MPVSCYFTALDSTLSNNGLGNALFQIATSISLAIDNNDTYSFPLLLKYYEMFGNEYRDNIFRNIPTDKIKVKRKRKYPWKYVKIKYETHLEICGYFVSYKYFHHNYEIIKKIFEPIEKIRLYLNDKYNINTIENSVGIHIRRGDYLNIQNVFPVYDIEYIKQALNIMNKRIKDITLFIFTDDIKYCEENIYNKLEYDNKIIIKDETTINSFYLMSMCKHNIIPNSTFSWWAAYLNYSNNDNKIVIIPRKWFHEKWFIDNNIDNEEQLYVPNWIII